MSYFKIKNNDCEECNKLSQLSFYTKTEVQNLIKTMGLPEDVEKVINNLLILWQDGTKSNIIDAINLILTNLDKKQDKSDVLDYLSTKTKSEIDDIIALASLLK